MDHAALMDKLEQAALSPAARRQLVEKIEFLLQHAIDGRTPRRRPRGRAGLRAEKGYFRLLYLASDFKKKMADGGGAGEQAGPDLGRYLTGMIRKMADIPDLQAEMISGIDAALDALTHPRPH